MKLFRTAVTALTILIGLQTRLHAGDIEWSGYYRAEGIGIFNSEMKSGKGDKTYGLHHLVLKPKLVAGDGLMLRGRFDIFNNDDYPHSQLGMLFGNPSITSPAPAFLLDQTQRSDQLLVSQFYLTYSQEFGALIVGRAPVHFGLGMTHHAGEGLFDHWFDNRDLVGYKVMIGNFFVYPILAKVAEGSINAADDITDIMLHAQYENPETDLEAGILYWTRHASRSANPSATLNNGTSDISFGDTVNGDFDTDQINLFFKQRWQELSFGVEVANLWGSTGRRYGGSDVSLSGMGIASETSWRPNGSKWRFGALAGWASGNDADSDGTFEGFHFDPNYEVGMLIFNHPLGRSDFLQNRLYGGGPSSPEGLSNVATPDATANKPDVERVSNAFYLAPQVGYQLSSSWAIDGKLIAAWLNESELDGDKDLGFEIDLGFNYRPNERVEWRNTLGILIPGSAFEGGSQNWDTETVYGISTQAAISF